MTRKLIVFDIDGTLITDDHELLEETVAAIQTLKEAGHMVMCATGRSLPIAKSVIEVADFDHCVLSNGAVAFIDGKQVYSNPLDKVAVQKLVDISKKHHIDLVVNSLDKSRLNSPNYSMETKLAMESFGQNLPEVDETLHERETIYQIVSLLTEAQMEIYEGEFPEFKFIRWHENGIDVLPTNGSKAEALKFIAEKYGFETKDIIAFGDGNNDMEMLQYAGVGIAMENGKEELKAISDFITLSNNNGGICYGLREYNLI